MPVDVGVCQTLVLERSMLHLDVCLLSGKCESLKECEDASLDEVLSKIERSTGIPADCQQWLVADTEVSFQHASTLAETSIRDGDQILVVHNGFVPLVPLPMDFDLNLTSVRERVGTGGYSSAFSIIYQISASIPEGRMIVEPWRKNDHDRHVYDSNAGHVTSQSSHWMA
jgi:hypothetical protein